MSPEDVKKLRNALRAGRIPADDTSLKYEFRKGWNEGVEFAQNQMDKIFGKEEAAA